MRRRPVLQRLSLGVALLAAGGGLAIQYLGGFDLAVAGLTLTVHQSSRLYFLAALAAAGFFLTGGRLPLPRLDWCRRHLPLPGHLAAALTLAVLVIGLGFGQRAVGGSDSYGYLSQAHLWLDGDLVQQQPWALTVPWPNGEYTFQPLGYTSRPGTGTVVPVYSPGLPLLMALAMVVGGACAAFFIVPIAGAVAVFGTYRLGRAVASPWAGVGAAWLLATSPVFLYMLVQPMSDVPATAAWVVAFLLAFRGTTGAALCAGLAAACAVLIRVNLAPMAGVLVIWFCVMGLRSPAPAFRVALAPLAAFLLGLTPGVVLSAWLNWQFYGSPFSSGYGSNDILFMWENVPVNAGLYSRWLNAAQTPVFWLGVAAICVPFSRLWSGRRAQTFVLCLALFVGALVVEYCLYGVFDAWWYLRFFLPGFPIVLVGLGALSTWVGSAHRVARAAVAFGLVVLGARGLVFADYESTFDLGRGNSHYALAGRVVRAVTEPSSVIFSMQHSGSLRYYAGRMTLRYDFLPAEALEETIAWLHARGAHPYALLDDWEAKAWRLRFAGRGSVGRLDMRPIRTFAASSDMALYDLMPSGADTFRHVPTTPGDLMCRPPAPWPVFVFGN